MASRTPRRKLRQHEPVSTRELILSEAMRLIARDGVEEMRIKDIADSVGIQMPSIYKHFANREAIIATLARNMVREVAEFLQPDAALAPEAWLESWAKGLVWFYATRPAYVRMILRDLATPGGYEAMNAALGPIETTPQLESVVKLTEDFKRAYETGIESGVFQRIDYSSFFATIYGIVLVSVAWPYSARKTSFGATEIDRLQAITVAAALRLAKQG